MDLNITVQREALLKPLRAVCGVVEKKQTLPILSNVLLTAKGEELLLTGTDLEVELIGRVRVENIAGVGSTTVAARILLDICQNLPEGALLQLTVEGRSLVVRSAKSSFKLNTLLAQDFPSLEECEYPVKINIKQVLLKNLLTKTYFAMGQQDVRHYLNGTFLDISQNTIKCVAADGHRLALSSIEDENIGNVEAKVILPRKSVLELMRLLDTDEENIATLEISDNRFRVTTNDYKFTTKLINAQYPDYNRLVPRGTTAAIGDRELIKQALTRASILSNEKFRGVRFQLEPGKLMITANNSDQEHAEEAVGLDYSGSTIEIGFNVAYLLDVVSTITTKTVRCLFTDSNSGVLIEPMDGDQSLYVVMPMRL